MVDIIQALVLGIVQGLTEFIPVSSSAHLVLIPWALGWPSPSLAFDTMAHWGTAAAILIYFRREWLSIISGFLRSVIARGPWKAAPGGRLASPGSTLAWWLIIATIPAAIVGLTLEEFVESLFDAPAAVGAFLLVTALILTLAERFSPAAKGDERLTLRRALAMGLGQALALAPGISRSGTTMSAGMAAGFKRDFAARLSFLMATPAILGAGLLQLADVVRAGDLLAQLPAMVGGFLGALAAGLLCIRFLLSYLRRGKLYPFSIYCAALGVIVLLVQLL